MCDEDENTIKVLEVNMREPLVSLGNEKKILNYNTHSSYRLHHTKIYVHESLYVIYSQNRSFVY